MGFNYRMTELQAALGVSQMSRLDDYVAKRHELARRYSELLADLPVMIPWQHADAYSAFHLFVIRLQLGAITCTHRKVFEAMREAGVGVNLHYIPVHTQPYYERMGFQTGDFPEAEKYYSEAISLPLYPLLSVEEQERVVAVLRQCLIS